MNWVKIYKKRVRQQCSHLLELDDIDDYEFNLFKENLLKVYEHKKKINRDLGYDIDREQHLVEELKNDRKKR